MIERNSTVFTAAIAFKVERIKIEFKAQLLHMMCGKFTN